MRLIIIVQLLLFISPLHSFAANRDKLPDINILIEESNKADWENSVQESVIINAPIEEVWNYVSDSTRANEWSVFFDHISPLEGIPDGEVGSKRRCFRMANERGASWDEMTLELKPQHFRNIVTYNLLGFKHYRLVKKKYVFVRQLFRAINENNTELIFQTQIPPDRNRLTHYFFTRSRASASRVFIENLKNIKQVIEGKARLFPWYE